jgi:hypothetical protein
VQQMRLRWMETSEAHSIPLNIWNENQVGTTTNAQSEHKEVLHLCRWSTPTHLPLTYIHTIDTHTHIYIYTYDYIHTYAQIARYIDT